MEYCMRKKRVLGLLAAALLVLGFSQTDAAAATVTNIVGGQFTVSWTSVSSCQAEVMVYRGTELFGRFYDDRGPNYTGKTHYVTVTGLRENTQYAFELKNGDVLDNNGGSRYLVTTGPHLIPAGSIQPAGKASLADGTTPAEGAIVYITVSTSRGSSAPMSTLVDLNGYWHLELINARTADGRSLFRVSDGEGTLKVSVVDEEGKAGLEGSVMDNQGGTRLYAPLVIK
jgi:hypothetical protein